MPVTFNQKTNKWVADYTDRRGHRHRRGFDTRKDAKAHLLAAEFQIKDGTFRAESEKITVREMCEKFVIHSQGRVDRKEIDRTSHHNYVSHVRRYILAESDMESRRRVGGSGQYFKYPVGEMRLKDLRLAHINRFSEELQGVGLSKSLVTSVVGTLRRILAMAVEYDYLAHNVAIGARRLVVRADAEAGGEDDEHDDADVFIPEKSEVAALCGSALPEHQLILWFASATGVRTSEQRALAWRHVDLEKGVVRIRRRVNRFGHFGQPKSKAGRRTIPIAPGLLAKLGEWKATSRFSGPEDLVFPNGMGNVEAHSNWRVRLFYPSWRRAQAAFPEFASRKLWRWHDLRHFAISCWIEADVPLKQVQKWAGHSSAQMTLDRYGHLFRSADNASIMQKVEDDVWKP